MNLFKTLFQRKTQKKVAADQLRAFADKAKAFVDDNSEIFVLLGDPNTDVIFMAYQGVIAPARILNRDGSRNYIVANALKHKRGQADIDRFLLAVDGGLFAIANTLYSIQRESMKGKILEWVGEESPPAESKVTLADGSVLAPIQLVDKE